MAEGSVNFIKYAVGAAAEPLVSAALVSAGLVGMAYLARKRLDAVTDTAIPDDRLSSRTIFEFFGQMTMSLGDQVMGRENRKYLPFCATIFLFIFFQNALGLIPGFSMATDSIWFNAGPALVVFVAYHIWGMREHGVGNYLKHFMGPVPILAFLMIPVEVISHCARVLSLSLRLYANMLADHAILEIFTGLTKFIVPVAFYVLGTFVCFVQAFVFALVTMVYIRLAAVHEDEH